MIKTNTLGLLSNNMYLQYIIQRKKLPLDYYDEQKGMLEEDLQQYPFTDLCKQFGIDFLPYHFTLVNENKDVLRHFLSFFIISLQRSEMIEKKEDLHYCVNNYIRGIYDIMNIDLEYLLAGISCMQYFFI